ncbi:Pumilio-like protein 3 [Trichoplax sp. H2]|nr:Pumilio-like protein 3 [Trichoplax sp. H2]|eukprot:RDD40227.1 Pumilio-like protein 3 [Trichoplax sp. H2]
MEIKSKRGNKAKGSKNAKLDPKKRKAKQLSGDATHDDSSKKRKLMPSNQTKETTTSNPDETKTNINSLPFKERRKMRKEMKDNSKVITKAKSLWESIRMHNISNEKRSELIKQLLLLISSIMQDLVMRHDTVRIVQCCLKFGNEEQRREICQQLQGSVITLSQARYSKFLVKKMLKYGTKKQRDEIIKSFYGQVRKLIRHKEAAEVLETAYNDYANASQRATLIEEFYGPEFAIFKSSAGRTLNEVIAAEPNNKTKILKYMHDTLTPLLDRDVIKHTLVHRALLEYFYHADPKMKFEMIEAIREALVYILHTEEGSKVTMRCIWFGTPKDRKVIIKSMKKYVTKICLEEHGHYAMLAIFDTVDDTVLVRKALLSEVISNLNEISKNAYGRKVLLYLLSARDSRYFHPDVVKNLKEGDGNLHSKKDSSVRSQELQQAISEPLVQFITKNVKDLILDNSTAILVIAAVENVNDVNELMKAIASLANEVLDPDNEQEHIIANQSGHFVFKKLIKTNMKEKGTSFSEILLEVVSPPVLRSWIYTNRGSFTLVSLMESSPVSATKLQQILRDVKQEIKQQSTAGCSILSKLLSKKT